MVFNTENHGLSYNYNIPIDLAKELSNKLLKSERKGIKPSEVEPFSQGISLMVFIDGLIVETNNGESLKPDRTIYIRSKDDSSVYVMLERRGPGKKYLL